MPYTWAWDGLFVAPPPEAQKRRRLIIVTSMAFYRKKLRKCANTNKKETHWLTSLMMRWLRLRPLTLRNVLAVASMKSPNPSTTVHTVRWMWTKPNCRRWALIARRHVEKPASSASKKSACKEIVWKITQKPLTNRFKVLSIAQDAGSHIYSCHACLNINDNPSVFVREPVFVNPCSYDAVAVVPRSIGLKAGVKQYGSGDKGWILVCDGVPYNWLGKSVTSHEHACGYEMPM